AGFLRVESADGDGGDLMRLVAERGPRRVLYLAGEERAGDLAAELRSRGIAVDMLVIYRAVADGRLRDDIRAALTAGEIAVLHFSQRSASAFVTAARADGLLDAALDATHFCLSRQVAQPLADAGARHIRVAARPDEAALLDLVEQR
ncbi:MAG TPA: uroporphyrinogen-III synthase, partial [Xanthobacteraceae bacterium]